MSMTDEECQEYADELMRRIKESNGRRPDKVVPGDLEYVDSDVEILDGLNEGHDDFPGHKS